MKPTLSLPQIPIQSLMVNAHSLFDQQWFLLTAGDFTSGDFNTMTISWGALGTIWHKPLAMVAVRPSRYTFQFMERYTSFTLSAFDDRFRPALELLGVQSGRKLDKIAASGLTPSAVPGTAAPAFAEAELVIACEKMYWQDIALDQMRDPAVYLESSLPEAHRIYFGEVTAIYGLAHFLGEKA